MQLFYPFLWNPTLILLQVMQLIACGVIMLFPFFPFQAMFFLPHYSADCFCAFMNGPRLSSFLLLITLYDPTIWVYACSKLA